MTYYVHVLCIFWWSIDVDMCSQTFSRSELHERVVIPSGSVLLFIFFHVSICIRKFLNILKMGLCLCIHYCAQSTMRKDVVKAVCMNKSWGMIVFFFHHQLISAICILSKFITATFVVLLYRRLDLFFEPIFSFVHTIIRSQWFVMFDSYS